MLSDGQYIYANNVTAEKVKPASTLSLSCALQSGTMTQGSTNKLTGNFSSNYCAKLQVYVDGEKVYTASYGTGAFTIGSDVNSRIPFSSLSVGTHTVRVVTEDDYPNSKTMDFTLTVTSAETPAPSVSSVTNVSGGKRVWLSAASGCTVFYTVNGSKPSTASAVYNASDGIYLTESAVVQAAAYSAATGKLSSVISYYVEISSAQMPEINCRSTAAGTVVSVTGDSKSTIYYSIGDDYQKYTGPFTLTSEKTVSAYAIKDGCIQSAINSRTVEVTAPDAPVILSPTAVVKQAQNRSITVRWNAIFNAADYVVSVYKDGELQQEKTVSESNATFLLEEAGVYTFEVAARNVIGCSSAAETAEVYSMAPVTITFVDWDGTVLSRETVEYGTAASAPAKMSRRGYTFSNWDRAFNNCTEDMTVTAEYTINHYTVTFYDVNGSKIGSNQSVAYLDAADPPVSAVTLYNGYEFLGWSVVADERDSALDIESVDSDMTATAVVGWAEPEQPVTIEIASANRDDANENGNYVVKVNVRNNPTEHTTAELLVVLKTSEGKVVKSTVQDISIKAGTYTADDYETYTVTLAYSGTATKAEAIILGYNGNYLTGSAYSEAATADVTILSNYIYGDWSEWSATAPAEANDRVIETKVQYKYRTKSYTSSTTDTYMIGWECYDQTVAYGPWVDNGTSYVAPTASREVETYSKQTGTRYYMSHYCTGRYYPGTSTVLPSSSQYQTRTYSFANSTYHSLGIWFDDLSQFSYVDSAEGVPSYKYYPVEGSTFYRCANTCYCWYVEATQPVYTTCYKYRSKTTTSYFYKWNEWSSWQDAAVSASSDVEVQTQTLYRYKDKNIPVTSSMDAANEDTTGEYYSFTGTLDMQTDDLSEKKATVLVYQGKNTDPISMQLQYAGQITLGDGNSYCMELRPRTNRLWTQETLSSASACRDRPAL